MPVSVNMPQRQQQDDPLEKLANALNIARQGFGIYTDMKGLEELKRKNAEALKQQEVENAQKDRGLDIQERSILLGKGDEGRRQLEQSKIAAEIAKIKAETSKVGKESSDPYKLLSVPDQEIVKDSAKKYSDSAAIKDSMDEVVTMLRDPSLTYDQKLAQAKGSLKLINSAHQASPDAVGKEEAERAAAFISPSLTNALPGRQGAVWKPDLEAFTQQLEGLSGALGNKAGKLKGRIESATGSPLRSAVQSAAPKQPAGPSLEELMAEKERRSKKAMK